MENEEKQKREKAAKGLRRMNAWMALSLFMIVAATAVVVRIFAANISNRRDVLSNQTISGMSTHDISFNLSGGNTFAAGEQFVIDFPDSPGFSQLGTWDAGDFAFSDGTARTIAGLSYGAGITTVVCPDGANNVGVAFDTSTLTFRFKPCGPSFAASAAGAFISLTIDGAFPSGRLVNPSVKGEYDIAITDAAGDCQAVSDICQIPVYVLSNQIAVTACVGGSCGGGGGGGGGGDSTPPLITNVHTQNSGAGSIDVCWDTNEASDSTVNYGLTNTYGTQSSSGGLVISHCVHLTGLTDGATYHFQVCSKDASNNQACSTDDTFAITDDVPPVISAAGVTSVTCNSAVFNWTTDELSTSYVDYSPFAAPPYPGTTGSPTLVTSHNVPLTGLSPGTTYHFRVRSGDAASNESFTSDQTFTTGTGCAPDTTPPQITNITVTMITADSARVCYDTNEAADARIDYGMTASYGASKVDGTYGTTRCFDLTGLINDTTYHFQLTSKDLAGNTALSADVTFKTLPGVPGQCNVSCSSATFYPYIINPDGTERKVGSNFVRSTNLSPGVDRYNFEDKGIDFDYNDVIVTVNHQNCGSVIFTADLGDATWHHIVRMEGYYNGVLSKDQLLWQDSQSAENQPLNINFSHDDNMCHGTSPQISNVRVTNITETSAIVSWDTLGTNSNSLVQYGTTTAYGSSKNVTESVVHHSVVLTGLTKGTLYHFRVGSTDSGAQQAFSNDGTFTTLTDSTPPANVGNLTAVPGDSRVTLNWTNPADTDFAGVKLLRKTGGYPTGPNDGTLVYSGKGTTYLDLAVTNGVQYFYAVFSYDDVPNYSSGALANATPIGTADTIPPGNVTNLTAVPGNARVQLNWNNPTALDFQGVRLMRKTGGYSTGPNDGTLVYTGTGTSFLDTGVVNDTQYFYTVYSFDAIPNYSSGAQANATPSATVDTTPPGPVTDLTAVAGDTKVQLHWTNPTDADWNGTRIVRRTGHAPSGPTDGTTVFDGLADNWLDTGLNNNVKYYYGAFPHDTSGNFGTPAFADATPTANVPTPTLSCADTDGGRNYDVKGTVTENGTTTHEDECKNANAVTENYCDGNTAKSETHNCNPGYSCNDGKCVADTNLNSEACGNGQCRGNENNINCPADCIVVPTEPPVQVPQSTVSDDKKIRGNDLVFYATAGKIQLRLMNGVDLRFYNSSVFTVMIPDPAIKKPIAEAFVNFDGRSYRMAETASFEASVITPNNTNTIPLTVIAKYEDGDTDSATVNVILSNRPRVYEDGNGNGPISGARVSLYVDNGGGSFGLWDGSLFGQQNPQLTDDQGRYAFIVPIGSYKLVAEKDGYHTKTTLPFPNATQNVIGNDLALIKLPPKEDIVENVKFQAKVAAEAIKEAINNEYVEQNARDYAAPAATIATIANVAAAGVATATVIPYLLYLYSLFAHPFLLIARRRRKQWGVVYNSLSKLPIDLAIVRLLDARTGRILRSAVTDKDGRYFFIVQPGVYKMVAVKVNYVFPSSVMSGLKEDAKYIDLYHGEEIEVKKETAITANIPLDPVGAEKPPRTIVLEGIGRRIQKSLGLFAIVAMVVATVITPTVTMGVLLAVNVVMYFVFRRLAVTPKPKNWGIVYEDGTKKPLQNVVARIFDTRFNKLLETQVTDNRGRYAFLVGNNTYYVTFEKPGYHKEQKGPVDLIDTKKVGLHVVAVDVKLAKTPGGAAGVAPHAAPPKAPQEPTEPPKPTVGTPVPSANPASGSVAGAAASTQAAPIVPPPVEAAAKPPSSGTALHTAVKPLSADPTPSKDVESSASGTDKSMSYEAKMLARLRGLTGKQVAEPQKSDVQDSVDNVEEHKITVMPQPGDIKPVPPPARETPQQLVQDLKDEASGAQNEHLLPDPKTIHPEDNPKNP